jgi:HlyD family secretion protein
MHGELKSLRIDRTNNTSGAQNSSLRRRLILASILIAGLIAAGFVYRKMNAATVVETTRVRVASAGAIDAGAVTLSATGYIITAHKIELASKVVGKVAWIGVEKGDRVREGQVLVRLEDDEYRARVNEATGALASLKARLDQLKNGSRPEEIAKANAELAQMQADLVNARTSLNRTRTLVKEGIQSQQTLDDAEARYNAQEARSAAFQKAFELVRIGPRQEEIASVEAQIKQAEGTLGFAQIQLDNTIIRAPVSGTVLERNVERGEFVTTGFVGDRGAKGYVVSLANLNDLQVELDINQNDFAKLDSRQQAAVTTDAYPDRKYQGVIVEISPEANRQKATVQVKVRVLNPDEFLRPEMNATVAFLSPEKPNDNAQAGSKPAVVIPASAVRDGAVYVVVDQKAVRRKVQTGSSTPQGVQIKEGLIGGEDLIVNPPADLKDGQNVRLK